MAWITHHFSLLVEQFVDLYSNCNCLEYCEISNRLLILTPYCAPRWHGKGARGTCIYQKHVSHIFLQWRHNERDGVSNHQRLDCLLNRLLRYRSKKTSKLRVTGLCEGNSPVILRTKGQWRWKCFHLMTSSWSYQYSFSRGTRRNRNADLKFAVWCYIFYSILNFIMLTYWQYSFKDARAFYGQEWEM